MSGGRVAMRLWVIGPVAWDWTFQVDRIPPSGGYTQARSPAGRPGGTGANVAVALASTQAEVCMVGYVGRDAVGRRLLAFLRKQAVDTEYVAKVDGDTPQVFLFIEPSGERTIIEVTADLSQSIAVPVAAISPGDIAYFAVWQASFLPPMAELISKDVTVATVPPDGEQPILPATFIIGSESHHHSLNIVLKNYSDLLAQGTLRCVVVTRGADGAIAYCHRDTIIQPAKRVKPIDTTGAGDAFTAGFLHQIALGRSIKDALRVGTDWGTAAVLTPYSTPPAWTAFSHYL